VLFVCLGNICRSPTAEAVFQAAVDRAGVADRFVVDSCGTGGGSADWYVAGGFSYHEGDAADARMTQVAAARGVRLTSRSRPLRPADLSDFDQIVCMDAANIEAVTRAAEHWKGEFDVPAAYAKKLARMTEFIRNERWRGAYSSVPDPYYGGQKGFELVLDLLEDACGGLLEELQT
jgi:protein-tyrosine phosphatase